MYECEKQLLQDALKNHKRRPGSYNKLEIMIVAIEISLDSTVNQELDT